LARLKGNIGGNCRVAPDYRHSDGLEKVSNEWRASITYTREQRCLG